MVISSSSKLGTGAAEFWGEAEIAVLAAKLLAEASAAAAPPIAVACRNLRREGDSGQLFTALFFFNLACLSMGPGRSYRGMKVELYPGVFAVSEDWRDCAFPGLLTSNE